MVKKWMKNGKRLVWSVGAMIALTLGTMGCVSDGEESVEKKAPVSWEDTWKERSVTTVTSQVYRNEQGNRIVYYCCRTAYAEEYLAEIATDHSAVDQEALKAVIDLDQATGHQERRVGDWPAVWCEKDGRSYLCWTISAEYSCVIEYDAEAVAEEDIFRMAESVAMK